MVTSIRPGVTTVAILDIDVMVRTHGVLNALAVTALVLTASTWTRKGALP